MSETIADVKRTLRGWFALSVTPVPGLDQFL
jgi:hypothetical protein